MIEDYIKVSYNIYDIFVFNDKSFFFTNPPILELSTLSDYFVLLLPRSIALETNQINLYHTKSINFYPDQSTKTTIDDLLALESYDIYYLKNRCVN